MNAYERGDLATITGETLRPGGLELTEEALSLCAFPPGATILDIGCGPGATVRYLTEKHGLKAVGVDASLVVIDNARAGYPGVSLVQGRGESLPIPDDHVDGILMECSFSLMEDSALSECYRVLKDRGRLIISDLYFRNRPESTLGTTSATVGFTNVLTKEAFLAKLAAHGFEVEVWQDKTTCLHQLVVDSIMKHGSADKLWECILPTCPSQGATREQIKAWKPGYFLAIGVKKATRGAAMP